MKIQHSQNKHIQLFKKTKTKKHIGQSKRMDLAYILKVLPSFNIGCQAYSKALGIQQRAKGQRPCSHGSLSNCTKTRGKDTDMNVTDKRYIMIGF